MPDRCCSRLVPDRCCSRLVPDGAVADLCLIVAVADLCLIRGSVITPWPTLWLRMEEWPPIWIGGGGTANIFNKQSGTADKGWSSRLGVGRGADNSSP